MPIPVWVPGQVLASADVNSWFVPQAVVKASNTGRTSATIAADPALTVTLAAGALYEVRCMIFYNGLNAGGYLQWNWTVPSGGAFNYLPWYPLQGGGVDLGYQVATVAGVEVAAGVTVGPAFTGGTGVIKSAWMTGLANGGSGGPLTFNWGQAVSNGTATTVQTNSYLIAQRIS
jgi:hypothetical protein